MTMRFLKYYAIATGSLILVGGITLYQLLPEPVPEKIETDHEHWVAPEINLLPPSRETDLIRYGKDLIINTAQYFGPKGSISATSNGMNCGNCHLDGGTRFNGNSFAAVASTYPKFRDRSGKMESIEYRINECFERSLNGRAIDTLSREMMAMVNYLKWLGKDVPKGVRPRGAGTQELPILNRAADVVKGKHIFRYKCQVCHGPNGLGQLNSDSSSYLYPPLWGPHSYNVSAGMYRIGRLAGFVKYNMPYTPAYTTPQLSNEEAWDVAAYINSQNRPEVFFHYDWPKIGTKPFDYPFGPFVDTFPLWQHKYGPFAEIRALKSAHKKK
jgi:thiosulfate dehydrogenase